ncbi:DUF2399 domain-containing protein [Streptomyces sp. NPDC002911]
MRHPARPITRGRCHPPRRTPRGAFLPPLTGSATTADWGPDLAPAMAALGIALHEEAALGLLVADLT